MSGRGVFIFCLLFGWLPAVFGLVELDEEPTWLFFEKDPNPVKQGVLPVTPPTAVPQRGNWVPPLSPDFLYPPYSTRFSPVLTGRNDWMTTQAPSMWQTQQIQKPEFNSNFWQDTWNRSTPFSFGHLVATTTTKRPVINNFAPFSDRLPTNNFDTYWQNTWKSSTPFSPDFWLNPASTKKPPILQFDTFFGGSVNKVDSFSENPVTNNFGSYSDLGLGTNFGSFPEKPVTNNFGSFSDQGPINSFNTFAQNPIINDFSSFSDRGVVNNFGSLSDKPVTNNFGSDIGTLNNVDSFPESPAFNTFDSFPSGGIDSNFGSWLEKPIINNIDAFPDAYLEHHLQYRQTTIPPKFDPALYTRFTPVPVSGARNGSGIDLWPKFSYAGYPQQYTSERDIRRQLLQLSLLGYAGFPKPKNDTHFREPQIREHMQHWPQQHFRPPPGNVTKPNQVETRQPLWPQQHFRPPPKTETRPNEDEIRRQIEEWRQYNNNDHQLEPQQVYGATTAKPIAQTFNKVETTTTTTATQPTTTTTTTTTAPTRVPILFPSSYRPESSISKVTNSRTEEPIVFLFWERSPHQNNQFSHHAPATLKPNFSTTTFDTTTISPRTTTPQATTFIIPTLPASTSTADQDSTTESTTLPAGAFITLRASNDSNSRVILDCGRNIYMEAEISSFPGDHHSKTGDARRYEFPWQVRINYGDGFVCGGSIISAKHVITSAHCVVSNEPKNYTIVLGDYNRYSIDTDEVVMRVRKLSMHPNYVEPNHQYDIAIFETTEEIKFDKTLVRPVCLPTSDEEDLSDKQGIATGWGKLRLNGGLPQVLQKMQVPIWNQEVCKNAYKYLNITADLMCGSVFPENDLCQGDTGGPLMIKSEDGRYFIQGVTSWGFGCAGPNLPGVYSRILASLPWIKRTLA